VSSVHTELEPPKATGKLGLRRQRLGDGVELWIVARELRHDPGAVPLHPARGSCTRLVLVKAICGCVARLADVHGRPAAGVAARPPAVVTGVLRKLDRIDDAVQRFLPSLSW